MKSAKPKDSINEAMRVLVIERPGYNVQIQRDAIARIGQGVEYTDICGWLRSLRPNDLAVVSWLHLLAPAPGEAAKPLVEFNAVLDSLMAKRAVVVEAATGTRSDAKGWPEAVARNRDVVRSGRHMTRREARKRGEKGLKNRPLSAEKRWEAEPKLFKRALVVWRSREHKNDEAAWRAVNDMLADMDRPGMQIGSKETARRIFKNRARG
jgi:hypothetical protein